MGVSAFPHPKMETHKAFGEAGPIFAVAQTGITKRELFAAMAMQGLLSNPDNAIGRMAVARIAVAQSDLLLKELEK